MARLGIITGLLNEARVLGARQTENDHRICVAGANSERAAVLAEQSITQGVDGLISFGLAGGLDPALSCGDIVLPQTIVLDDRQWPTNGPWRQIFSDLLSDRFTVRAGAIAGSGEMLSNPDEKHRLFKNTGAVAVDMESHAIAAVAAAHDIPFIAVRIVADPGNQSVPAWLANVIDDNGETKYAAVFFGMISHPFDLPDLIRLARYNRKSVGVLGRVALVAGIDFGFGQPGG